MPSGSTVVEILPPGLVQGIQESGDDGGTSLFRRAWSSTRFYCKADTADRHVNNVEMKVLKLITLVGSAVAALRRDLQ